MVMSSSSLQFVCAMMTPYAGMSLLSHAWLRQLLGTQVVGGAPANYEVRACS